MNTDGKTKKRNGVDKRGGKKDRRKRNYCKNLDNKRIDIRLKKHQRDHKYYNKNSIMSVESQL